MNLYIVTIFDDCVLWIFNWKYFSYNEAEVNLRDSKTDSRLVLNTIFVFNPDFSKTFLLYLFSTTINTQLHFLQKIKAKLFTSWPLSQITDWIFYWTLIPLANIGHLQKSVLELCFVPKLATLSTLYFPVCHLQRLSSDI